MKGFHVWFDEFSWEEAEEAFKRTDIAVIPTGATHPHGVACPLGTDTFMAYGLAERIGRKTPSAVVLPVIPFGRNEYHMDFPGTISITTDHLRDLYMDISLSLHKHGVRKLVWLNPHGGNKSAIEDAAYRLLYSKGMLSARVSYWLAGEVDPKLAGYGSEGMADETAMMLYLRPELAHPERSKAKPPLKNLFKPLGPVTGFRAVKFGKGTVEIYMSTKSATDTCEWGSGDPVKSWDMANATQELGKGIIETAADYIVEFIEAFKQVKIPPTI